MAGLNVALVAGSMPNFSAEGPLIYRRCREDLKKTARELDFDLTVYEDLILSPEQAANIRVELDRRNFDLVMIFHPTYLLGDVAAELMKTGAHIGLWAVEEPSKDGPLPLASLVCLNQNIAIAAHCFRDKRVKWFFGNTDSRYFKRRFEITVRALRAVRELKDARVAQIGPTAPGFLAMAYDEKEIHRNLGVTVVPGIEIKDVLAAADAMDDAMVRAEMEKLRARCRAVEVGDRKIEGSVRIFLATRRICEENGFKAAAFSCWPELGTLRNLKPCVANALLDSSGIPVSCEGDMLSAISMLVLKILGNRPVAVMDLPAFDDADDSILLWHCGSAPFEMANKQGVSCRYSYRAAFDDKKGDDQDGPVADLVYAPGPVTVFRFTGEGDQGYYVTGDISDAGKKSWDGSRGWVYNLKFYGEPIKAIDLMNTILVNGLPHHYPFTVADVSAELEEMAVWLGLRRVPRNDYTDYLQGGGVRS